MAANANAATTSERVRLPNNSFQNAFIIVVPYAEVNYISYVEAFVDILLKFIN